MTTSGRLRIWNRNVDPGPTPPVQTSVGIAVRTAVGSVAIVTEDPAEPGGYVGATVEAGRAARRLRRERGAHADHPTAPPLPVRGCGKRSLYPVGRRRCRTDARRSLSLRSSAATRVFESAWRHDSPASVTHRWRSSSLDAGRIDGPAQIRTAVTATRRPKDAKLPHRPASKSSPSGSLMLPNVHHPAVNRPPLKTARSRRCRGSGDPP